MIHLLAGFPGVGSGRGVLSMGKSAGEPQGKRPFSFYLGFPSQSICVCLPFQELLANLGGTPGLGGGTQVQSRI